MGKSPFSVQMYLQECAKYEFPFSKKKSMHLIVPNKKVVLDVILCFVLSFQLTKC